MARLLKNAPHRANRRHAASIDAFFVATVAIGLWRYHMEEIDQWGEDGRPTSSRSEAVESGTSSDTSAATEVASAQGDGSLIAQAAEMIGCGREDSNLHGCYPTRSLV
jgi:hypothetical protein